MIALLPKTKANLYRKLIIAFSIGLSLVSHSAMAELTINDNQTGANQIEDNHQNDVESIEQNTATFKQSIRFITPAEMKSLPKGVLDYIQPTKQNLTEVYKQNGIRFQFATISGQLFGTIDGDVIRDIDPAGQSSFTLSLPNDFDTSFSKVTESYPNLIVNDYGQPLKLARLSTLSTSNCERSTDKCQQWFGGAGFLNGNSMKSIALVYASSKADIKGYTIESGQKVYYDVSLPNKGWHWVETVPKGNTFVMEYKNPEDVDAIIFAI